MLEVLPVIFGVMWIVVGGLGIAGLYYLVRILQTLLNVVRSIDASARTAQATIEHVATPIQKASNSLAQVASGVRVVDNLSQIFRSRKHHD